MFASGIAEGPGAEVFVPAALCSSELNRVSRTAAGLAGADWAGAPVTAAMVAKSVKKNVRGLTVRVKARVGPTSAPR
jgi:hypothetical protein